jgi:GNAT superfamily N-acetyltransferase
MRIEQATASDLADVLFTLQEAAQWLQGAGRPLWTAADLDRERIQREVDAGAYWVARAPGGEAAGAMRLDLEDPHYWPEIAPGSSLYLHKLAVRRAWAGQGVSTVLLSFARQRTRALRRPFLRLDCVADRQALRTMYEGFGFALHSEVPKGRWAVARYELAVDARGDGGEG